MLFVCMYVCMCIMYMYVACVCVLNGSLAGHLMQVGVVTMKIASSLPKNKHLVTITIRLEQNYKWVFIPKGI